MNTDWGAKGAQLTGAQVQSFIKQQFRELMAADQALADANKELSDWLTVYEEELRGKDPQLHAATDGCFVAYHRRGDNWPCAVPYWEWPDKEAEGEVADGVLVLIDGQAPILVAPTEDKMNWSQNAVGVNTKVGTDHERAYSDFSGQTRTAALIAKKAALYGTDDTKLSDYAAGYCYSYDRSYESMDTENDKLMTIGVDRGKWWLPSIAELVCIWKHRYAINLCLSVIADAMPLGGQWYWSSTEATASTVWRLNMATGAIQGNNDKTANKHLVRPVTSFYSPAIFNTNASDDDKNIVTDERFQRIGDCLVYMPDEDFEPIPIKLPISKDKILNTLISFKYTDSELALITVNYQLATEDGLDTDLKREYTQKYQDLLLWRKDAETIAKSVTKGKPKEP